MNIKDFAAKFFGTKPVAPGDDTSRAMIAAQDIKLPDGSTLPKGTLIVPDEVTEWSVPEAGKPSSDAYLPTFINASPGHVHNIGQFHNMMSMSDSTAGHSYIVTPPRTPPGFTPIEKQTPVEDDALKIVTDDDE